MNSESTLRASYREITKNTLILKSRILSTINEVFLKARCNIGATTTSSSTNFNANGLTHPQSNTMTANYTPFVYGFGNRENDAKAYTSIGIPSDNTFLINTASQIKVYSKQDGTDSEFNSYDDKKLQKYILSTIHNTLNHYKNIEETTHL